MIRPIVYGPGYSTYARSARLALEEKGVPYDWVEVDFLTDGMPAEQWQRHPFGKVPSFEHDGFALFETEAILRYVDEAFDGPPLQPVDVRDRARMTQVIAVIDHYAYAAMVHQVMVPRVVVPMRGGEPDEALIATGLDTAGKALDVFETTLNGRPFLAGGGLSLADLSVVPVLSYFTLAPEGAAAMQAWPEVSRWYAAMRTRPSVARWSPEELVSP